MTLDATNVLTGVSGEVLVGLTSATYPASAAAATTGFTGLGYLGPDGVLPKSEKSTNDLTAWQNNAVVRTTITEAKRTFEFTLWETNVDTIEFAYGVTVTQSATEGAYTIDPSATSGRRKFVIDVVDGENTRREMFEGELTTMEESGWKNGEPIAFKCTVTVYGESTVKDTKLKTAE
jgi:hypothetical protein